MSVENLNIDIAKMDFSSKSADFTQKTYSKEPNGFSNVFESANKSYNFSFEKNEKFSAKSVNQYSDNKDVKSFKSEYEDFHSKIKEERKTFKTEERKKFDDEKQITKEDKIQNKEDLKKEKIEDKKQEQPDNNKEAEKSEKSSEKETGKSEKITGEKETENSQTKEIEIVKEEELQKLQVALDETKKDLSKEEKSENQEELPENKVEENSAQKKLNDLQNQMANEKIINKQAEKMLQSSKEEKGLAEKNPAEKALSKEEADAVAEKPEKSEQSQKAQANSKPEVIVSQNVLEKTEAIAKNQPKLAQPEGHQKATEKLAEAMSDESSKPVITNIQVSKDSSGLNSDGQSQKQQLQQEIKVSAQQLQNLPTDENNTQKLDTQKTSQFDKVLNGKTSQNLENSVMTQLKDKISSDLAANKSEVTIALRPDNLGKVSINLVSQNGVLTAQITAENNQVKDILSKGLESLKHSLTEQGLSVGKVVVNVQEPANNNNNSENSFKNLENNFNANQHSGKQNFSEQNSTSGYGREFHGFEEEADTEENNLQDNTEKQIYNSQTTTVEYTI